MNLPVMISVQIDRICFMERLIYFMKSYFWSFDTNELLVLFFQVLLTTYEYFCCTQIQCYLVLQLQRKFAFFTFKLRDLFDYAFLRKYFLRIGEKKKCGKLEIF